MRILVIIAGVLPVKNTALAEATATEPLSSSRRLAVTIRFGLGSLIALKPLRQKVNLVTYPPSLSTLPGMCQIPSKGSSVHNSFVPYQYPSPLRPSQGAGGWNGGFGGRVGRQVPGAA